MDFSEPVAGQTFKTFIHHLHFFQSLHWKERKKNKTSKCEKKGMRLLTL